MICLQNHPKVDRKKWRHDVIIVTSKLTLWHKITIILYEKIFASTKSAIFSIAPGPIHKIQLRDFDLIQPRDTVTSWRHSMTHPNLFSLSQLVDVLERWFFFCFYETLGCWVRKCCQFCICMMTSCHDVMSWRQKTGGTLSQLVEVLERWFFFCFYSFPARLVWKCYRFCVCMMSWRHDVTSWSHKTHFSYISLSMF